MGILTYNILQVEIWRDQKSLVVTIGVEHKNMYKERGSGESSIPTCSHSTSGKYSIPTMGLGGHLYIQRLWRRSNPAERHVVMVSDIMSPELGYFVKCTVKGPVIFSLRN